MKKSVILVVTVFLCYTLTAQVRKPTRVIQQNEKNISVELKTRLAEARQEIRSKNLQFQVGVTSKAELPLAKITGERQLTTSQEIQLFNQIKSRKVKRANEIRINPYLKLNPKLMKVVKDGNVYGSPGQSKLDLRTAGYVTPVGDQGVYGTCWAFGAMAAYESQYKIVNKQVINTSEQYLINCSGAGTSSGGLSYEVFDWMVDHHKNVAKESSLPYSGPNGTCPASSPANDFYAVDWDMVDPTLNPWMIPTVQKIKDAICKHGVVVASVYVTNSFKLYTSGQYYGFESNYSSPSSNHSVGIIGWDDTKQCWLIKNSWGTGWGATCGFGSEKGYMWIKYNSNNIGRRAAWVTAEKKISFPFKNGVIWHDWFCIDNEIPKVGDFNGDGKDDIVTFTRGTTMDVYVAISDGKKFNGQGVKWHNNFCRATEIPLAGDFNGDGKDDIVTFTRGSAGDVYVALSNGSKFTGSGVKWHDSFCLGKETPLIGDFNGDGKDDIATFTGGKAGDVYVALSNGSKFTGTGIKWHDSFCLGKETPLIGDFNGDGKDDIATFTAGNTGDVYVAKSNGSKFIGTGIKWHDEFCYGSEQPVTGDYNGDKKCDILTFLLNSTADVYGAVSTGTKFNGTGVKVHDWFGLANEIPMTGDFNGDKKADLITFLRNTQPGSGKGDVYVGLSK